MYQQSVSIIRPHRAIFNTLSPVAELNDPPTIKPPLWTASAFTMGKVTAGHAVVERLPFGARPYSDVIGQRITRQSELPADDQAIVVDGHDPDGVVLRVHADTVAQGLPVRPVPARDVLDRKRPALCELSARDQRAIVDRQRRNVGDRVAVRETVPECGPCASVPLGNVVGRGIGRPREGSPDDELPTKLDKFGHAEHDRKIPPGHREP